ncbi:MAG: protein-export chaperone SecB [Clostridia bacterium]|nr:protein-export chaperone SecB [Clostridia bacterium]
MENSVELKAVRAENISFINKLEPNSTIQLGFSFKHNLHYPAPNIARAEMSVVAEDKSDPEKFRFTATEIGVFSCPPDMSRETIHVETFRELFPFIRALCVTVTSAAGVPPVMIPQISIKEENVCRIDFRPPKMGDDGQNGE